MLLENSETKGKLKQIQANLFVGCLFLLIGVGLLTTGVVLFHSADNQNIGIGFIVSGSILILICIISIINDTRLRKLLIQSNTMPTDTTGV